MRLDKYDFKQFTGNFYQTDNQDWSIDYIGHKPRMHFSPKLQLHNCAFVDLSVQRRHQMNANQMSATFDLTQWLPQHPEVKVLVTETPIPSLATTVAQFIVPNTWQFYREIAGYIRQRYQKPVITVTGSVGKTTTRLMIAQLIRSMNHSVVTNYGNDNVRIVLPQLATSLLRIPDALVAELSIGALKVANFAWGSDRPISELYRANTAIITQIGGAHARSVKGKDPIMITAETKAHIFNKMSTDGQVILNYDMIPKAFKYLQHIAYQHVDHVYTFSRNNQHADAYVIAQKDARDHTAFKIRVLDETYHFRLTMAGDGPIMDLLAACLAIKVQGWQLPDLTTAFTNFKPLQRELAFHQMNTNNGKATLVEDTYNSTKYSVENALSVFKTRGHFYHGLKILVIETGDDITNKQAEMLNLSYREDILASGIDVVLGYRDPTIKPLIDSLASDVSFAKYYPEMDPLADYLRQAPADSLILIKGQHFKYGSDLRLLTPKLLAPITH